MKCKNCGAPWNTLVSKCEYCNTVYFITPNNAQLMTWFYGRDVLDVKDARRLGRPGQAIPVHLFPDQKISDVIMAVPTGFTFAQWKQATEDAKAKQKEWFEKTYKTNKPIQAGVQG